MHKYFTPLKRLFVATNVRAISQAREKISTVCICHQKYNFWEQKITLRWVGWLMYQITNSFCEKALSTQKAFEFRSWVFKFFFFNFGLILHTYIEFLKTFSNFLPLSAVFPVFSILFGHFTALVGFNYKNDRISGLIKYNQFWRAFGPIFGKRNWVHFQFYDFPRPQVWSRKSEQVLMMAIMIMTDLGSCWRRRRSDRPSAQFDFLYWAPPHYWAINHQNLELQQLNLLLALAHEGAVQQQHR